MDLPPVTPKAFVRPAPPPVPGAFATRWRPVEPPGLPRVGVEIDRSHGLPVARVVDLRTGFVISQTPPEQVLDAVQGIIESIVRRERADGHR